MTDPDVRKNLYIVVCSAGPAAHVGTLVSLAHADGWVVKLIATPAAVDMIDAPALEQQSGSPVRSQFQKLGNPRYRSSDVADALIVAPATYNTINKLANGINDTYALNVTAECIGRKIPVTILPFVNAALSERQPFTRAVHSLRDEGVRVIFGPDQWLPHQPGTGAQHIAKFPWTSAIAAASGS